MSFPNVPNVTPNINLTRSEVIDLLLASIAFEELSLAHITNAEAEKIQHVLGTNPSIAELKEIDRLVERVLRSVIKKEMLLEFKLEDVLQIPV